jgi:RNA polymerase sigma factor (sigma-70 family)
MYGSQPEYDELSWLHSKLPGAAILEADRNDRSLARIVADGHRLWRQSAEGRGLGGAGTYGLRGGDPGWNASISSPRRVGARLDDAQSRLLLANMGIVLAIAQRYRNRGVSVADLVQEGSLGLLHAMHRFDPERNVKFVTFAYYWVHEYVARAIANKGHSIRLPAYVHHARQQLVRARAELVAEGVTVPSDHMVAERAGMPLRRLKLANTLPSVVSLDAALSPPVGRTRSGSAASSSSSSSSSCSLSDLIADVRQQPADQQLHSRMFRQQLDLVLGQALKPRAHRIMRLRYGLDGGRCARARASARGRMGGQAGERAGERAAGWEGGQGAAGGQVGGCDLALAVPRRMSRNLQTRCLSERSDAGCTARPARPPVRTGAARQIWGLQGGL